MRGSTARRTTPTITVKPQRDPAAYQRLRKARNIEKAVQIRKCYEEHQPPQIAQAGKMISCGDVA